MSPFELGASLYVPALRDHLEMIANGHKYPFLRSVIFCTEDSIAESDLPRAMLNLKRLLPQLEPSHTKRFIRVRNPEVLSEIFDLQANEKIDGFVLPKVAPRSIDQYLNRIPESSRHQLMLTLETQEVFDLCAMRVFAQQLSESPFRSKILSLRIGGNDLLQILGLRRERDTSAYSTILGHIIGQLVIIFRPHGFNLTAPVYEYLDRPDLLAAEVRSDLAHGLFGKTAIHPQQVPIIEACYRVSRRDEEMALAVIERPGHGVFRLHDSMCEPATHHRWAKQILERARHYGIVDSESRVKEVS
jgi:citrate lyase beta subunit